MNTKLMLTNRIKHTGLLAILIALIPMIGCQEVTTLSLAGFYARPTPPGAVNGAVFMLIQNPGEEAEYLTGAETDICERVEIHETVLEDGTMRMRPMDKLEIPAGDLVELKPGGYHIMLINLKAPLKEGDTFDLKLNFQNNGSQVLPVPVRPDEITE